MSHTVFLSWQADTPNLNGRNFVEKALGLALKRISADIELAPAIREGLKADKDTKGVPGFPPIVDTIFSKIDSASIFIVDLTFVGVRMDGRPTPNPNVLIEYGWALKSLSYGRIIPFMNVAYGEPAAETMPFDMAHLRHPITYICPDNADDSTRRVARDGLAKDLEKAIRLVLDSDEFKATLPKLPEPPPFPAAEPKEGQGRFRAKGEPLGNVLTPFFKPTDQNAHLVDTPVIWLRVMPETSQPSKWGFNAIKNAAKTGEQFFAPLWYQPKLNLQYISGKDGGVGVFSAFANDPNRVAMLAYAFETGEVWSINAYSLNATRERVIPLDESMFAEALERYCAFLDRLGCKAPYKWIAGIEDTEGRGLYPLRPSDPAAWTFHPPEPQGSCQNATIISNGIRNPGQTAADSLRPFFDKIYDECRVEHPHRPT